MNVDRLISELKGRLSAGAAADLDKLAESAEFEAVITRHDGERLARRQEIGALLASHPKRHAAALESAGNARIAAEKRQAAAEVALQAARDALVAATVAAYGAQHGAESEFSALTAELVALADPRLKQVSDEADRLTGQARHLAASTPEVTGFDGIGFPKVKITSNIGFVGQHLQTLRGVSERARALQFDVTLDRAAVTALVVAMLADMNAAAEALHLKVALEFDHRGALVTRTVAYNAEAVDGALAELGVSEGRTEKPKPAPAPTRPGDIVR